MESSLRDLAKAYANGLLVKEKYRSGRTAFIEGVLAGKITIRARQSAADKLSTTFTGSLADRDTDSITTLAGSATSTSSFDPTVVPNSGKKTALLAGGIALVVVIIAVIFMIPDKKPAQQAGTEATSSSTVAPPPVDIQSSPAQDLIRSYLASNSWTQASMDNFQTDWNRLSPTDRETVKNSLELGQLTNAIYKKLLEERALSGIGNPETSYEKQRILVQFATSVGITDPKISLPEPVQPAP